MLLIRNCRLMDPASGTERECSILLDEGRVERIGDLPKEEILEYARQTNAAPEEILMVDAKGLIAAPGLVDVHVHFRDPGQTWKEDILTGAAAAAAGGFTSVVCMANTSPCVDSEETLDYVMKKAEQADIHVYQAGCITMGMQGKHLTDMKRLKEKGAPGFTDDGKPILEEALVRQAMEQAAALDVPLSFHEEDPAYITESGYNHGAASEALGIGGADRMAEIVMVKRDLELALETGAAINIQHISSKESVELVREALKRERGKRKIHAEATPHHFSLTEEACTTWKTLAKMNPPLRSEEDRLAIIEGLKDGTIDLIATDHAPHSEEEKNRPLTEAPSGIIGLETSLALGITYLVKPGHLTMQELLTKMTVNPAGMYHLDAGYLKEGGPADLVLFDPEEEWTPGSFVSKSANSPFLGAKLTGRVKAVVCDGILHPVEKGTV